MKYVKKETIIKCLLIIFIVSGLVFVFLSYKEPKGLAVPRCDDCNVILISIDTLRADRLPCYGHYRNTAPHICDFAKEGILFENAFSHAPNTLPSHMSIFTSLYPFSHGVKNIFKDKLDEEIFTLPQILKAYNYTTVWFGPLDNPYLSFEAGYGRGIDEKFESVFREFKSDEYKRCNNSELFGWLKNQEYTGNKFFMFYHTYQVHVPYTPKVNLFDNRSILNTTTQDILNKQKQVIKEMFYNDPDNFFSALNINDEDVKKKIKYPTFWDSSNLIEFSTPILRHALIQLGVNLNNPKIFWKDINSSDSDELNYVISLYDSEIVEADACLNKFFDKLKEEGFYDKTIIIVTSDHGEEFMEHGSIDHNQLYDETLHVPLILKIPNLTGFTIDRLVESIDIMPTLLSLISIPTPYYTQGKNLLNQEDKNFIHSEWNDKKLLRSKKWSFIMANNGNVELYDLIKDPKQTKNIAQEKIKITENMKTELKKWSDAQPKYYKQVYDFKPDVSNETRENIIKTGYW